MVGFADLFDDVTEETSEKLESDDIYTPSTTFIGPIMVDLLEDMTPSHRWEITRMTVDGEADYSDHRTKMPVDLSLLILITDDVPGVDEDNQFEKASSSGKTKESKVQELQEFVDINNLIEVVTPFGVYPSMMVTSLDPQISKDMGNASAFLIGFSSLKISGIDIGVIDPSLVPQKRKKKAAPLKSKEDTEDSKKGKPNQDTGTNPAEDPDESWFTDLFGEYEF